MIKLAADSSIIISIARMLFNGKLRPTSRKESAVFEIMGLISKGELQFVVTPTILKEIQRGSHIDQGTAERFVERFCEIADFDYRKQDRAYLLADAYGNCIVDNESAVKTAQNSTERNYNDCLILAETVVEQSCGDFKLPFITANYKDVFDIIRINEINKKYNMPPILICSVNTINEAVETAKLSQNKNNSII